MTQHSEDHTSLDRQHIQFGYRALTALLTILPLFSLPVMISLDKAFGGTVDLIRSSGQQHQHLGEAGDEGDVHGLEPGKPIKRELVGGQAHTYQIRLSADQFLRVMVEQDGIDVVVVVAGPDGKRAMEFDYESMARGQEPVSWVAEMEGDYRLIVQPRHRGAPAGRYGIRIEELRAARENDRALHEARMLCEECIKIQVMGPPAEAHTSIERALEIRERVLGPDHRDVAIALNGLGRLYRSREDSVKAESLFQRSLAILEKTHGPEHPAVAPSLNNLAHLYRSLGDYARAEALFQRALAIMERSLGPEHPNYAFALHNLGLLYWSKGNYAKAEPLFQQALVIWKRALNPEHPDLGLANNALGNFYRYRGDYARAETFYRSAMAIREKSLGPEHPDVAHTLNNLAIIHRDQGNYGKAEPLANRALGILERALGPEHPDVARTLNNLALLHHNRGDHPKAESLARRALVIWERSPGQEHPDAAYSLNILALICRDRGDYGTAERLFQRSLAIWERALGPKHPYIADALNDWAMLHAAMGEIAQAVAFQSRANAIFEQNLALNLEIGSERQNLVYLASLSEQGERTISLHLRYAPRDPAARDLAAAVILQRKGRALDATSQGLGALRSRSNPEDQALLDQLSDTRSQLASLILGEPQKMTVEEYQERIRRLEDQTEKFEADIGRRSSEFRAQSLPVTLAAVQSAIPPGAALIEFASYRPFDAKAGRRDDQYGQPRYVAYVLRREGEVRWKELGEANSIDKAIVALREALRDSKRRDVKRLAHAVDRKIFQHVRPLLGDATRLLISPDGLLNLIPFAALVDERGRYLVERYSISYLTSGRDLLRLQIARESKTGPLVVAAPDFGNRSQGETAHLPERSDVAPKEESKEQVERVSTASAFSELYFPPLPYAAQEGEALSALLPDAKLLTNREATKAALNRSRSPMLLHIATHGFFLEDLRLALTGGSGIQAVIGDPDRSLQHLERSSIRIENPLLRSGLALAGANEDKDDGILTALEVTGLNLWGTKLVVLSACGTGVGEVKNGDGVHGLRRALVLSGSESQVMSLWAISDKATRELMVSYYRLLQQGEGRGEALRQVQLEMLKNVNRQHPYYWAGFIQSGEWANLEGKRSR
jgi:CHAT domain-containing protein/Tfp pilus assembly protein PilF